MSGGGQDGSREVLIDVRNAEIGYPGRRVLDAVTLEVRAGDYWFFLGPNGSGKTTLLRCILGLLEPRRGRVALHPGLADRRRLGFVPQRCDLNPSLPTTVREFVSLGFVGTGLRGAERRRARDETLERAGLAGMERRSYWDLSGGQKQRALLARALVRRPRLLIVDEPTEGLDVAAEEGFLAALDRLRAEDRLTLVFVTHHLAIAAHHATHVAFFHEGRVVSGPRDRVLGRDALRRVFGVDVDLHDGAAGAARGRGDGA